MPKRLTKEEWIARAKEVHGEKYDYSRVVYINQNTKVEVVCPEHGPWLTDPGNHIHRGSGCPVCGYRAASKTKTKTTQQFVAKAKALYGNRFDYSEVEYQGCLGPVTIICRKHGRFEQIAVNHLQKPGCVKCWKENVLNSLVLSQEEFVDKARQVHGDKYDYSKTRYKRGGLKVCIVCPEHGEFWQEANSHLTGRGCPTCGYELAAQKAMFDLRTFIKRSRVVHGTKFDYSRVVYQGNGEKVEIICPVHGSFWQRPADHWNGIGCPNCRNYQGEEAIAGWLDRYGFSYERQKRFSDCRHKNLLSFDFCVLYQETVYLIEYDGELHFRAVDHFGGKESLKAQQKRDKIKNEYAKKKGYRLIRIPYTEKDRIDEILKEAIAN